MRSARVAIATVALALVVLPFALLVVAWGYEQAIVKMYEGQLQRVAEVAAATPFEQWPALGKREGVWLRRLRDGAVDDSGTERFATHNSSIGSAVEAGLSLLSADTPFESLAAVDAEAPAQREEVLSARSGHAAAAARASDSGQTMVVSFARPLADGSVLVAVRASHRGVRQLLLARRQLGKLMLYQLFFAAASAALLGRWLVKPLERLTARAQVWPTQDIAEPALLGRRDEVGQLARAFTSLTHSLDERRQDTVDLAADIAHEFKNPLAAIAAASELMVTTADATAEKRARVHGVIVDSVERLRATTDSLLSLVRLQSTLSDAPRDALDYAAWLEALLDSYRADPRYQGATLELQAAGAGMVQVVAEAWASMLRNLLDNALVQPADRLRVRVRARREGPTLITEVTDFGPGVSEGNRDKVFHRFFTARPPGVPRGTGLGLAIVRAVAQAHGGTAELLPAVAGEGATFRVSIPAATPLPHRVLRQSLPGPH